jgi:hypothetical protein
LYRQKKKQKETERKIGTERKEKEKIKDLKNTLYIVKHIKKNLVNKNLV